MSTHLFVRSSFSLMESTIRIPLLAEYAKKLGYDSIALTDHNVLHGFAQFQHACEKEGIHPVYGMEADCTYHDEKTSFLLLAKDNKGYQDLITLSTVICTQGRPCTLEELKDACGHCFLIAWSEGGYAEEALVKDDEAEVRRRFTQMKEDLPPFFMALSYQESGLWKMRNETVRKLCRSLQIPTVPVNRIYYLKDKDADAFQVLNGIRDNKRIDDRSLTRLPGRYVLSPEEMAQLYPQEELQRSDQIASACRCDLQLEKTSLPEYPVPSSLTAEQYLTQLCLAGLEKRRRGHVEEVYRKRLHYELSVIVRMHFENYFLIVWDFVRHARSRNIYVGPGRGSAAGSLVAYCLGITMVDPIKYNLLFERFLNPERVTMPDIDTDFPDNRRQEVIDYVYQKYGSQHIANIIAFNTFGARQAIKDVGKAMNIPEREVEMLVRMIPKADGTTLASALKANARLNEVVSAKALYRQLFRNAARIEGLPKHTTLHAAGIVMSKAPLAGILPVMKTGEGMLTSQYPAEYLEERGLIKMDFLGVRNLTTISVICDAVQKQDPSFSIWNIPLDPETFRVFATADTTGIFQFESAGMKNLLRRMQPDCFNDVVAALALFRPASKDAIPQYLEGKRNPAAVHYPVPALEPVLKDTYGVMIYQEQAMKTAQICAGFSLGKADRLRKAMSKKKLKDVQAMEADFMNGCRRNGYDEETAKLLFHQVSNFAGYGFNKSHAVAYGMVACAMAYLKANHPLEFYCALSDSVIGDDVRTSMYIDECRRRNIRVEGPSVLTSSGHYQIHNQALLLPLSVIKGFGYSAADTIVNERNKGMYLDYFDFAARVTAAKINRRQIEMLINAGALDGFGLNRTTMKYMLDEALSYADLIRIDAGGQTIMDDSLVSKPMVKRMADNKEEVSESEREALGFTLGPHPIIQVRQKLSIPCPTIARIRDMTNDGRPHLLDAFAYVESVKMHRAKTGAMMAFARIMDETGEADLVVFPKIYAGCSATLIKGVYIRFHVRIEQDGSWLAQNLQVIDPSTVR
ncbi:MAG: DNA polymerase III subunit alpha [Bulleidia sp.]|nr:DNA polymerase III subunit alpha [Bulleidia sp.]